MRRKEGEDLEVSLLFFCWLVSLFLFFHYLLFQKHIHTLIQMDTIWFLRGFFSARLMMVGLNGLFTGFEMRMITINDSMMTM